MKKSVTILTLFVLTLFFSATAFAQSCPTLDGTNAGKKSTSPFKNENHERLSAVLESNLSLSQQAICVISDGKRTFASGLTLPSSILTEEYVNGDWEPYLLDEASYTMEGFLGEIESKVWNAEMEIWENDFLVLFDYDSNGFTTGFTGQVWDGAAYQNEFRNLATFDQDGNRLTSQFQSWYNGDWFTDVSSVSEVKGGLVIQTITQAQNEDSTMLVNNTQLLFEYDGEGREILQTTEIWDEATEMFMLEGRTVTEYQDMMTVETMQFTFDEGATWTDFSKSTSIFDGSGLLVESIFQTTDFFTLMLADNSRVTYAYNASDQFTEIIYQDTDGMGGWINDEAEFLTYSNGLLSVELGVIWDGADWANSMRYTYSYDMTGTAVEQDTPAQLASFSVYPSPARDHVQMDVALNEPATVQVEVFDLLGRRVANLLDATHISSNANRINWSADQLPAGMYMVRLTVDEKVQTRPLMLVK